MCVVCLTIASLAAVAVSFTISGCSKDKSEQKAKQEIKASGVSSLNVPTWISSPEENHLKDFISSIGISKKPTNKEQLKLLLAQAELEARKKLSTAFFTQIIEAVERMLVSEKIELQAAIKETLKLATQQIAQDALLLYAKRDKLFQDENGVLYVRLAAKITLLKQYLKENSSEYMMIFKKEKFSENELEKLNHELKSLFDNLEIESS